MPVIAALGRLRQGGHRESEASPGCMARPCVKKPNERKMERQRKEETEKKDMEIRDVEGKRETGLD